MSNLEHLVAGGKLQDQEGYILKLDGVRLVSTTSPYDVAIYTLKQIEEKDMKVFISEEEEEIKRLREVIKIQNEEIQRLNEPKQKQRYKHMTKAEVLEAKEALNKGATVEQIMATYDVSYNTARRIENGKHTKL